MRAAFLTIILGWAWSCAAGQSAESDVAGLRQIVVDLSDDEFGNRERATRLLWESGDRALVEQIVQFGSTAEARSRAAQVLTSYQWGIVPGVSPVVREQVENFRSGTFSEKRAALSELMWAGHLQIVAGGLLLTSDPVQRDRLNQQIRAMSGMIVPREFAAGHDGEVRAFLATLGKEWPEYARDLKALDFQPEQPLVRASRIDDSPLPPWVLSLQSGDLLDKLQDRPGVGTEGVIFDLLVRQHRLMDAVETLRSEVHADGDVPAAEVLRRYLAGEAAKVKTQNYSKKALGLAHDVDFQPTGFVLSGGTRSVLGICHEYGLPELIEEAGALLAERTKATAPAALPAFCAWASWYPELRELAIGTASAACEAGIPPQFAIAPMCNPYSLQGRWFEQFVSQQEKRVLLPDSRNGGWGALGKLKTEWLQSSAVRGHVAMATGAWEEAALAFRKAVNESGTQAEGAVFAFLASVSFARSGRAELADQWRQIAVAIPLADEAARAVLADTMQRYGDSAGAMRNRTQLIDLHTLSGNAATYLHALRMTARSLELSDQSNLPFATKIGAKMLAEIGNQKAWMDAGEVAQDVAFYHQCGMLDAIRDKKWEIAEMELTAAHQCSPGALDVFELLASLVPFSENGGGQLLQTARRHLVQTNALWQQAVAAFPGNAKIERKKIQCRQLEVRLANDGENSRDH
ncbi:MAG: hypothetical protein KDN22_23185 [Verrucomicrobiae bacterium]|nr:hypothetical protein [Verrucomicrobiae bacterium]